MEQTYKIKDPRGSTHDLRGDPSDLTLQRALGEVGKTGGERWSPDQVKVRISGRDYRPEDFSKSFSDLGIQPGTVIELVEAV